MKIKRTSGLVLLIFGIVVLPVALLLNQSVGKVFSKDFTSQVLHEQVFSTPQLAIRLKAVVNERIQSVTDLKTGMIVAIFSKASLRKWQDLLDGLLPETLRNPIIDNTLAEIYYWLDNEESYPDITIQTQPVIEHLEENTEFLFHWAHSVTNPPMLETEEIMVLKQQNYGDSIPPLLLANVPDSLYDEFAQRGGHLMALQLQKANPPAVLNLRQMIQEKVPEENLKNAKVTISKVKFLSRWLWTISVVAIAIGVWLYAPGKGEILQLSFNSLLAIATGMFALGWMATNYLLANLELEIHANAAHLPRAIRDQIIALITYFLDHAGSIMYPLGFASLGAAVILYTGRLLAQRTTSFLQLKPKKS